MKDVIDFDKAKFNLIEPLPPPTDEIWIADDVVIECNAKKVSWWQRKIIKFLIGWEYKKLKKNQTALSQSFYL